MESSSSAEKPKSDLISPKRAKDLLEKMGNPPDSNDPYLQALKKISEGEESLSLEKTISSFSGERSVNWRVVKVVANILKGKLKQPNSNRK